MASLVNRYLVFSGDVYYARGGWSDFRGSFSTLKGAIDSLPADDEEPGWAHIIDMATGAAVYENHFAHGADTLMRDKTEANE